ncbi:MAG TPA: hypothetical protein PKK06_18185 [Phycisphaerae bacterium]|nr:hypothetical protein [Phycisphaerae bacterium]
MNTVAKGLALLSGIGVLVAIVSTAKGNVLIFAFPLALWVATLTWPGSPVVHALTTDAVVAPSHRARACSGIGWRVALGAAVWCAALGVLIPRVAGGPRGDAEIEAEMQQVEGFVRAGQWVAALRVLDDMRIPAEYPLRQAQRQHNRGVVLMRLNRHDAAAVAFRSAWEYDSSDTEACVLVGRLALERGDACEALVWLKRAEAAGPDRDDVRRMMQTAAAGCDEGK